MSVGRAALGGGRAGVHTAGRAARGVWIASAGLTAAEVLASHAIEAAEAGRAHTEWFILNNFVQVERAAADASVAGPLAVLRSLYALYKMDQSPSFLRGQYVSPDKARRIQEEVVKVRRAGVANGRENAGRGADADRNRLGAVLRCALQLSAEVKEISRELVEAFAIPDFLLGDIAFDYINAYRYDNEDPA